MSKVHDYETALTGLPEWDEYLLRESGLPGPRGNLELADAFANIAGEALIDRYAALGSEIAPTNDPHEFLAFCGVLGFGRLVAEGQIARMAGLRRAASDPRWRLREACARALQRVGDSNLGILLPIAEDWCGGTRLEQRAALAAICEPRLLLDRLAARTALVLLDRVTVSLRAAPDSGSGDFRVLRQGLGYCWSVAVVALPAEGMAAMERWLVDTDREVQWVMRENLGKARLERMDAQWVRSWRSRMRS